MLQSSRKRELWGRPMLSRVQIYLIGMNCTLLAAQDGFGLGPNALGIPVYVSPSYSHPLCGHQHNSPLSYLTPGRWLWDPVEARRSSGATGEYKRWSQTVGHSHQLYLLVCVRCQPVFNIGMRLGVSAKRTTRSEGGGVIDCRQFTLARGKRLNPSRGPFRWSYQ